MPVNQEIINITNTIKDTINCDQIYLFGSYAYGTPSNDSDYDFYVIIPDNTMRPLEAIKKIYSTLAKTRMKIPVDILALNSSKFIERSQMLTLENKVIKEGVILYDKHRYGT